ncbi:MAG: 4Fe-4S binding protein [Xanthomonadales bacterium]|nr:4Fe-4S binding protein [Xanthomonadales bacterium]
MRHLANPASDDAQERAAAVSGGRRFLRWRVATLIAVNVAIVVHLLHGWWAGETFGRVVFADAKAALESGVINPGFLLFALALLLTALFGRFFCGWACHMAALQDLCAWLLQRIGIRPRLFRSRLLGYVPLLLALYLFVWPSVERSIVVPLLARVWPSALAGFDPPPPISGWSLQWTSNNLWAGMPELRWRFRFC